MDTKDKLPDTVILRNLGRCPYEQVFCSMKEFTGKRNAQTADELWITEHDPIFTLGQAAKEAHILNAGEIPVCRTDRGGEVTYHGPGQVLAYLLFDLKRRFKKLYVRELVSLLEEAVIVALAAFNIPGERRAGAPGVYIPADPAYGRCAGAKIAALGLKIGCRGCMYHGLALNVAMDLAPFQRIDPCGFPGLAVTDMRTLGFTGTVEAVQDALVKALSAGLNFDVVLGKGNLHGA